MFRTTPVFLFFVTLCLFASGSHAEERSFVADAIQAAPGREARSGKLYISKFGTRFEFTMSGEKAVQIILPKQGLYRLLFPKSKTYVQASLPTSRLSPGERPKNPCEPTSKFDCFMQGHEQVGKMRLERWIVKNKKTKGEGKIWWDRKRRMLIRHIFPDASELNAIKSGTMMFEGRHVEQWKTTLSKVSGVKHHSYMLYAPDLGFSVMEQSAQGLVKELHNIKPIKADASLYEVPLGYRQFYEKKSN